MATMLIDGQTVAAQTGKTIEVRNPANGEVVDTIPKGSASEVDAAVEAAAKALPAWASLSGTKRAAFMHAAAAKVKAAVPEIAKLLTLEQGKPLAHSVIEATRVAENLEYFAGFADKLRGRPHAGVLILLRPRPYRLHRWPPSYGEATAGVSRGSCLRHRWAR